MATVSLSVILQRQKIVDVLLREMLVVKYKWRHRRRRGDGGGKKSRPTNNQRQKVTAVRNEMLCWPVAKDTYMNESILVTTVFAFGGHQLYRDKTQQLSGYSTCST